MSSSLAATGTASPVRPLGSAPAKAGRGLLRAGGWRAAGLLAVVLVLGVVALLSLALGSRAIPLGTVVDALQHYDPDNGDQAIVRSLRVPRTVIGLLAGVALGLAGAMMQGVARNPLADPGILGVNAGAALAVLIAMQFFGVATLLGYVWFAFLGAAVVAVFVYAVGSLGREGATPVKLALAGSAVTALLGSLANMLQLMDVESLGQFRFWVVGSLAGRGGDIVAHVWPFVAAGTVIALLSGRPLNTLSLGDDVARSLGQKVGRTRAFVAAGVVLLAGSATAAAGPIVFVGLTIPHVAHAITGPDYRWILPYSAVLAPILLLSADIAGRLVVRPGELSVGILTALIGAPFFIVLVRRRKMAEL